MDEFALIDWLRRRTPADPRVLLGPGDDCAAVRLAPDWPCLITTDMLLEGSCFLLAEAGPRRVGRKAMAVNLSDIAAMAGQPTAAVVSLGLPRQGGLALAEELYRGLREMGDAFNVAIVGGDTNSWDGPLVISVTLVGQPTGRGPVTRSGAKPGDWLVVTGELGGSILGKHLDFTPRIHEAISLHASTDLHAMIDVSDGLAGDVNHLCEESHCGAVLWADRIPISDRGPANRRRPLAARARPRRWGRFRARLRGVRRGGAAVNRRAAGGRNRARRGWRMRGGWIVVAGGRKTTAAKALGVRSRSSLTPAGIGHCLATAVIAPVSQM